MNKIKICEIYRQPSELYGRLVGLGGVCLGCQLVLEKDTRERVDYFLLKN